MELHDWLLCSRLVSKADYRQIVATQFHGSIAGLDFENEGEGFLDSPRPGLLDSPLIRRHPVGDVIAHMRLAGEIFARAGVSDLDGLVAKWQEWHVDNLEPICTYGTASRFGRKLYQNRTEKKLVAWFVTKARVRGDSLTIVKSADTVVIPEGSSGFYVGLGLAAWRKGTIIITSNGPLYCEYMANPVLAKAFKEFHFVGGHADAAHAGAFQADAEVAYHRAISLNPRATVVIMPVSGLLPDDGPFATEPKVRGLKHSIIEDSIGDQVKEKVHELVFITDYTKHMPDGAHEFGTPILEQERWHHVIEQNRNRLSVVTAPPPSIREALAEARPVHPVSRVTLASLGGGTFSRADHAYNEVAHELAEMLHNNEGKSMFHEADSLDDPRAVAVSATPGPGTGLLSGPS